MVTAPARVTVKAGARYLVVRMSTTRRSLASAAMSRPGVKRAAGWHFLLPGGTSIVRLRLPAGLKRPAAYKVVWTLVSDSQKLDEDDLRLRSIASLGRESELAGDRAHRLDHVCDVLRELEPEQLGTRVDLVAVHAGCE